MPHLLLTTFSASSSGIGALGINAQAFVIQLITFVLVFLILKRYAFKPILRVLDERRKKIESGVDLGEQMQKEKAELEAKVSDQLHAARAEADRIISSADQQAQNLLREAEDSAKLRAERIVKEADTQIEQNTQRARKKLETEVVGLVSDLTEAVIEEKVDTHKDNQLIDRLLKARRTT